MNDYLLSLIVVVIVCGSFLIGVWVDNYYWQRCCKRRCLGSFYFSTIMKGRQIFRAIVSTVIALMILVVIWYAVAFGCNGFSDFLFNHNWIIVS